MSNATTESYMNSTETPTEETLPPFVGVHMNFAARVLFIFFGSIEIIVGVVGNLLLLSVMMRRRYLRIRSAHKLFLVNLALCDLLTLGYWMTYFVLDLYTGRHPVVNMSHCVFNAFVVCITFVASALSLTSITLNRYLHVCHDRVYTKIFSLRVTVTWCLMVWVVSAVVVVPPLWGVGSYYYNPVGHFCSFNRDDKHPYPKFVVLFCSLVPMFLVGYWNYAIYRFWKNARDKLKKSQQKTRSKKDKRRRGRRIVQCWKPRNNDDDDDKTAATRNEQPPAYDGDDSVSEDALESSDDQLGDEERARDSEGTSSQQQETSFSNDESKGPGNGNAPKSKDGQALRGGAETGPFNPTVPSNQVSGGLTPSTQLIGGHSETKWVKPLSALAAARKLVPGSHVSRKRERSTPLKQLQNKQKQEQAKEEAFVRSLRVVFFLLVISFFPYGISVAVNFITPLPPEIAIAANIFLYTNNALNWIVYGVMNPSFRKGYIKNLRWLFRPCLRARSSTAKESTVTSTTQSNSQTYTTDGGNTTDSDVEKSKPKPSPNVRAGK